MWDNEVQGDPLDLGVLGGRPRKSGNFLVG